MARNLKVGRVNTEAAATTQRELEKGDRRYWTPTEGRNQVRIMPPPADHEEYFARAGFHYGIGPDDRMFPCPKLGNARKNCYLCEEADRLMRSKDEDDVADGKELRATKRYLITVVDIDKPKDKFQVWPAGVKAFREVNYYFSDPEWGDVSDLEEGFDFIIIRKGQNLNTEYSVRVAKKPSNFVDFLEDKLGDAYSDELFDDLPVLEEFLEYASDADMEAAYNGISTGTRGKNDKGKKKDEDDEDEDEDEEEAPPTRRGRGKSEPNFPDEDEDDKFKGKKGKGKTADEEEDEDEDEDEEAETPPASSRTRSSGRSSGRASGASTAQGSRLRRGLRS